MELKKYSISEASKITGYQSHVLRYYEKEFELSIPRNKSNHRYYTVNDIEIFHNIKNLQERGLTNSQIKVILNSPKEMENNMSNGEVAVSTTNMNFKNQFDFPDIKENLNNIISILNNNLGQSLGDVLDEIHNLRSELIEKDQDIILCENAKLKMKIKRKSYEIAELKEELNRERNKKSSIIKRIFS